MEVQYGLNGFRQAGCQIAVHMKDLSYIMRGLTGCLPMDGLSNSFVNEGPFVHREWTGCLLMGGLSNSFVNEELLYTMRVWAVCLLMGGLSNSK